MLRINDLIKNSATKKILKSINMNVEEGMIYGFIGHNGAGKSTTMRSIVGLTKFNSGEIIIDGTRYTEKVTINQGVGYLPESPNFYNYMTGKEYMNFIGRFDSTSKPNELLAKAGLEQSMNQRIGSYSRGMKQRLGMAVAMIHNPRLMIMDEPTSALDPFGRHELFDMIKELRDRGSTIILSTHILDDIEKVSDKIGIISGGTMLKEGKVSDILLDYFHPIYDVVVDKLDDINSSFFEQYPLIEEVSVNNNTLSIQVYDVEYAQGHLLQTLLDSKLKVVGFDLRQPSLEDVFMKEVQL